MLAVSELAADAFDSGEVGVSGARPVIHSASSLAGAEHLCDAGKQLVFFTVVDGHIGRAVRIKVGGQQKLSDVQVVTVHSLLNFRPADQVCVASLSPMITTSCGMGDAALTLHPATLSSECLLSMYCWEQSSDNVLYLSSHCEVPDAFEQQTPSVLRTLSLAPDGAPDDSFADAGSRNLLAYLEAEGFIAGPPWKFTVKGKHNIACGAQLQQQHKVCRRAPEGTDLSGMTLYELILELDAKGFEHRDVHGRKMVKEAKRSPYNPPSSEKIWYTRSGQSECNRLYVLALPRAEPGHPVPPFGKSDIYRSLLGMKQQVKHPRRRASSSGIGPCPDDFEALPAVPRKTRKKAHKNSDDGNGSDDESKSEGDADSDNASQDSAQDDGSQGDALNVSPPLIIRVLCSLAVSITLVHVQVS